LKKKTFPFIFQNFFWFASIVQVLSALTTLQTKIKISSSLRPDRGSRIFFRLKLEPKKLNRKTKYYFKLLALLLSGQGTTHAQLSTRVLNNESFFFFFRSLDVQHKLRQGEIQAVERSNEMHWPISNLEMEKRDGEAVFLVGGWSSFSNCLSQMFLLRGRTRLHEDWRGENVGS
jgi:hypothetical protein